LQHQLQLVQVEAGYPIVKYDILESLGVNPHHLSDVGSEDGFLLELGGEHEDAGDRGLVGDVAGEFVAAEDSFPLVELQVVGDVDEVADLGEPGLQKLHEPAAEAAELGVQVELQLYQFVPDDVYLKIHMQVLLDFAQRQNSREVEVGHIQAG